MGSTSDIINIVMQMGIDNLPTLTVCACLWIMVKNGTGGGQK